MVNEKGLDPAAADRIGEFVQLSGGVELADKLTPGKRSLHKSDFINLDFLFLNMLRSPLTDMNFNFIADR